MTNGPLDLAGAVAEAPSIALAELVALAELQTRSAHKYLVTTEVARDLIGELAPDVALLEIDGERTFGYETVYFDTPERDLYHQTAYRRPRRFKVRTRKYSTSASAMLEIKTKNGRGSTVKHRLDYPPESRYVLTDAARRWVDETIDRERFGHLVDDLEPSLTTKFRRATAVDLGGDARYTFDEGLTVVGADGAAASIEPIIVECKSLDGGSPADRWLWRHGIRPAQMSKYCVGLATLEPSLPSNHWHRTMRKYPPSHLEAASN